VERPEIASTDGTSEIASTTDGNGPSGSFVVSGASHGRGDNQRDDGPLDLGSVFAGRDVVARSVEIPLLDWACGLEPVASSRQVEWKPPFRTDVGFAFT